MFLQFIDSGALPGVRNMSIDIEWLQKVAREDGRGIVRFYQWQPYCISVGMNQSLESIDVGRCRADGIDVVRRPTGGRAVLHAEELTYSVILPESNLGSIHEVYRRLSEALAEGLRAVGIEAAVVRCGDDLRAHYRTTTSASCFSSSTEYEIQVKGKKIVGSAQRRSDGAMLQHGSILIGPFHRRIVNYLKCTPTERETMQALLDRKTTETEAYRSVSVNDLKKSLQHSLRAHLTAGVLHV